MLYYNLNLGDKALRSLAASPVTIYSELIKLMPTNLDKRIVNNTVYFYFDKISRVDGLPKGKIKEIRLQYMRCHQGAIYGDMSEFFSIPEFEGGQRIEIRLSDATASRTFKRSNNKSRQTL